MGIPRKIDMPKTPKKLPLYKPLCIVLKENLVREKKKESELEKFMRLSRLPKRNLPELERMRQDAAKRLREQLLRLTKSDDFRMVAAGGDCIIGISQNVEKVSCNFSITHCKSRMKK